MSGARARIIDELTLHGAPIDFRELAVRAIPTGARTLLLDLDRTVHLGRNMGELLGWEICAHHSYGAERLDELEVSRGPGRFALDWERPKNLLRYASVGARMWAKPGLYYFFWGKLAWQTATLRRLSFAALGPEPVRTAQRVPQTALMHHMAELPLPKLRDLAARVWKRHAPEQVITREDLAWLRRRCPSLRVVLTSASPQPMLEIAAEALDVDEVIYSRIEEREGWLSAPAERARLFDPAPAPRRISPPSALRINAGPAKISEVERRSPEALGSGETVGISDTGYGEDHCWAQHLTRVIDVNSTAPFPPIVGASSPARAMHSAALLTQAERAARDAGAPALDPRRGDVTEHDPITLTAEMMAPALADLMGEVGALLDRLADERGDASVEAAGAVARIEAEMEIAVHAYNEGHASDRPAALAQIDALAAAGRRARRDLARSERPAAEAAFALSEVLHEARSRVDVMVARAASRVTARTIVAARP